MKWFDQLNDFIPSSSQNCPFRHFEKSITKIFCPNYYKPGFTGPLIAVPQTCPFAEVNNLGSVTGVKKGIGFGEKVEKYSG